MSHPRLLISVALLLAVAVLVLRSSEKNILDFQTSPSADLDSAGTDTARGLSQIASPSQRPTPPLDITEVKPLNSEQREAAQAADQNYKASIQAKRKERTSRIQQIAGFKQRVTLQSGGIAYQYIPGLFALPESDVDKVVGPEIGKNAGYVFFEVAPGETPPSGALPGVVNENSERLGVITGIVTVEFKTSVETIGIARDFRLQTVQSFDHLKIGILRADRVLETDMLGLLTAVQSDSRVAGASLEVVEALHVPR